MAVVDAQAPVVRSKTACYQWYRGAPSSHSAPGPAVVGTIKNQGLLIGSSQPGLPSMMAPRKTRIKPLKRNRNKVSQSQVLLDHSVLSSLLDNPSYNIRQFNISGSGTSDGARNRSMIQEHLRVPTSPLFFSTSCPCNMEKLSYPSPTKKLQKIPNRLSKGSLESSPTTSSESSTAENSPLEPADISIENTYKKLLPHTSPPKCSTPKQSMLKISPPDEGLRKINPSSSLDEENDSSFESDRQQVKEKTSKKKFDSKSATTTPKSSPKEGSGSNSSGESRESQSEPKKTHSNASKAGAVRASGLPEQCTCRRNLLKEFEGNLTFRPAMNRNSMKIAAKNTRKNVPLEQRLLETKKREKRALMERAYTFSPHLNPYSIKLARDRASRQQEVQAKQAETAARALAAVQVNYTFKPAVSEKSQRIAEGLQTSFLRRQEMHLERRKNVEEPASLSTSKLILPRKDFFRSPSIVISAALKQSPTTATPTNGLPRTKLAPSSPSPPASEDPPMAKSPLTSSSNSMERALAAAKAPTEAPAAPPVLHLSAAKHKKTLSNTKHTETRQRSMPKDLAKVLSNNKSQSCSGKSLSKRLNFVTRISSPSLRSFSKAAMSKKSSTSPCKKKLNPLTLRNQVSLNKGKTVSSSPILQHKPYDAAASGDSSDVQSSSKVDPLEVKDFSKLNSRDKFRRVKILADRKIKERKVFLLKGGYRLIRRCLRKRGWVELKYHLTTATNQAHAAKQQHGKAEDVTKNIEEKHSNHKKERCAADESNDDELEEESDSDSDVDLNLGLSDEEYSDEEEYAMVCRSVRNATPNLVWTMMTEKESAMAGYDKNTLMNHFPRTASLTTKVGLCNNLRNLRWYGDEDPDTFFPRCYKLACDEDKESFVEDYRINAAISILKIISEKDSRSFSSHSSRPSSSLQPSDSRPKEFPASSLKLVLQAIQYFMASKKHQDIEGPSEGSVLELTDSEWSEVIQLYYAVREGSQIKSTPEIVKDVRTVLKVLEEVSPQYHIDGTKNMWIIKPGALSRGRGIICMTKMDDILNLVAGSNGLVRKANRWVVQKYIEHPLLIFNTKFDIRQWFLVTCWNPLTMWMYKESYLRFSTQPFTLDSLNASIHLCNNSIQRHCSNCPTRSSKLPPHNMWDNVTFMEHLNSIGKVGSWDKKIYPGMKKALIHVLLVTQDDMDDKKNCFELYGADFMVDCNLNPWLIEINSCPTMESSTEVTKRLCRQVLEDTIKVIVDKKESRDCNTGQFELAFKQPKVDTVTYVGTQLCVLGQNMPIRQRPLGHMDIDGNHRYQNTVTVVHGRTVPGHLSLSRTDS